MSMLLVSYCAEILLCKGFLKAQSCETQGRSLSGRGFDSVGTFEASPQRLSAFSCGMRKWGGKNVHGRSFCSAALIHVDGNALVEKGDTKYVVNPFLMVVKCAIDIALCQLCMDKMLASIQDVSCPQPQVGDQDMLMDKMDRALYLYMSSLAPLSFPNHVPLSRNSFSFCISFKRIGHLTSYRHGPVESSAPGCNRLPSCLPLCKQPTGTT